MINAQKILVRIPPLVAAMAIGWSVTSHATVNGVGVTPYANVNEEDVTSSAKATSDYPNRTIEVITHAGNGGGTDLTARMMMLHARKELGKDMVIVNKKGGGGAAAMEHYKTLPADGHSILTFTISHAASMAKGKVDTILDDYIPIARATDDPQIIMSKCGTYKDANELIELQKNKILIYGVTHLGNIDDISATMFSVKGELKKPRMLPFDGGGQLAEALAKGIVDAAVLNLAEASELVDTGKLCPLVVLAEKRMARIKNTPTAMELGIPVKFSTVRGFVVHKDTPPHVVKKIEAAVINSMKHEFFQSFLISIGLEANSVAGSKVWGKQIAETHAEMKMAFDELGIIN